ncbi:thioredoxin H2-like [Amaranthus tricolor]|uniref:thioredoxin H2-like n=1 Tax=Amaranthus tricolor TaxID=29722 RepID=UPI00258E06F6|nr:thioredoxin H2-like [Amaranthus tricolor]
MGGRLSTIQDNRSPVITSTPNPTSLPPSRWSSFSNKNLPETRAFTPSSSFVGRNGCNGGVDSDSTLSLKASNNKGVIAFHSAAKWREYFQASKHSNNLVVIYFTAAWCGPCRYMEPTIKELAAKYADVDLVKIDVDELFNVSREFGVQTMPTFILMKNGNQINKVVGAKKEDLQRKVEKHRA